MFRTVSVTSECFSMQLNIASVVNWDVFADDILHVHPCLFIFTLFAMVPQHHWLRRSLKIFKKPPHIIISFRDVTTLIHTGLRPLSSGELSPVGLFWTHKVTKIQLIFTSHFTTPKADQSYRHSTVVYTNK